MLDDEILRLCQGDQPILIAGCTASGKNALGLKLAHHFDGTIINADALQVYAGWHILTARPDADELSQAPHHLYGHVPLLTPYSTGHWLREVEAIIKTTPKRPIILGGTGLYFQALTDGLADIPMISEETRRQAEVLEADKGRHTFREILERDDPEALTTIDANNPARTRRAWEVWTETGKPLRHWQADTAPSLVSKDNVTALHLSHSVDWLNERIEKRFDLMLEAGALEEVQAVLDANQWDPHHPSCKAIGAAELVLHHQGEITLEEARDAAITQTRQYAKRQRTWFRSKMSTWNKVDAEAL